MYAQLTYFDGPRTPEQIAASDFSGRERIMPAVSQLGHRFRVYVLRRDGGGALSVGRAILGHMDPVVALIIGLAVGAVLGVVITMGSIGGTATEIGEKVAAALVGTFLGILLAYGMFAPFASRLKSVVDDDPLRGRSARRHLRPDA